GAPPPTDDIRWTTRLVNGRNPPFGCGHHDLVTRFAKHLVGGKELLGPKTGGVPCAVLERPVFGTSHHEQDLRHDRPLSPDACRRTGPQDFDALRRDRKSTRLNSSHVSISYAVFCLKKKRTISQRTKLGGRLLITL